MQPTHDKYLIWKNFDADLIWCNEQNGKIGADLIWRFFVLLAKFFFE